MRGAIVAIGGGEVRTGETQPLDEHVVRLTGKLHPNALFIPTALGDPEDYVQSFEMAYKDRLGCKTDVLRLVSGKPDKSEIARKVAAADLFYVGGGSTLNLMRIWRKTGLDKMLKAAWEHGAVLSGVSAGANCWFQYGHSDSRVFFKNPAPGYIRVTCLGFVRGTYCPHVLGEGRLEDFKRMIAKYGGVGYAVDNLGAVLVKNGENSALRCNDGVFVRRIMVVSREIVESDL